jgi:hypothetical protein
LKLCAGFRVWGLGFESECGRWLAKNQSINTWRKSSQLRKKNSSCGGMGGGCRSDKREGERDMYQLSTTRDWTSFSPSAAEHMVEDSAATGEFTEQTVNHHILGRWARNVNCVLPQEMGFFMVEWIAHFPLLLLSELGNSNKKR